MTAEIHTERGRYTGQTVQSIVRRVYGRDAVVWHIPSYGGDYGTIVKKNRYGNLVLGRLIYAHGEWNINDTDSTERDSS
jgi:hypothetical protein